MLALIVEEPRHGWAVSRELLPTSDLGRVWSLSRPLTYRAIDVLEHDRSIRRGAPRDGEGADRSTLTATGRGRRLVHEWLDTPVIHLRDVRTELLVKLILRDRLGLRRQVFLSAQRKALAPVIDAVLTTNETDLVSRWRRESAESTRRFLDAIA